MYFYYHINVQKSSQQPIFMSVALLNPRTHWISRPSSSKDVQINVSTSLGNKQRFDHNKRNRCLAKNHNFSIFPKKLMKVRESLHLPCSQQSFSLQQLAPPWQTNALLLVEVEEEEEATSAVQQVAWVDFKDQNWWCSRLPKCNHGGEKYSPLCSLLKPPPRSSKLGWDNTAWSRYSRSPKWGRCRQPKMKSCLCKIELEFIWTLNLFRCSWVHEGALKNLLLPGCSSSQWGRNIQQRASWRLEGRTSIFQLLYLISQISLCSCCESCINRKQNIPNSEGDILKGEPVMLI